MAGINDRYLTEHKLFRIRNKRIIALFPLIAILVAIVVFWCLKLVGITVTSDALCELEEHTHISTCYADNELICFKPEHTHSSECFPDRTTDIETAEDWTKSFADVTITNNVAHNLASVASSQVGYKESTLNYEYDASAEKNSYSRYGEWYGNPYGNWNTMFVSFCINYANIKDSDALEQASAEAMRSAWSDKKLYLSAEKYMGATGDVVFFDTDGDNKADRTGITTYSSENMLIVVEGDVEGAVESIVYRNTDTVLGFGKTSGLSPEKNITYTDDNQSGTDTISTAELTGRLNRYIPDDAPERTTFNLRRTFRMQSVYDSEPLVMMAAANEDIIYTSHLEGEVVNAVFKQTTGESLTYGDTVYVGQTYIVSLEFSEINTGTEWVQFRHDEDGYLTYHIPDNLECDAFDSWHPISAKTENGTIQDVGEYFVDEDGLLRVKFFEDSNGQNFVDKYANVDFTIDFSATVESSLSGSNTDIVFSDKININLAVDGGAGFNTQKEIGAYDPETNTVEYTISVIGDHGLVRDLVINDDIWEKHYALRDTIVITDLNGNILDPQPVVSDHPNQYITGGFSISGFPAFSKGEGFLIKYKAAIYDELLSQTEVGLWNGLDSSGKDSNGNTVTSWAEAWDNIQLEKMEKDGKQTVLTDNNGNSVPAVEWEIAIRKSASNIQGSIVVDTLGEGLEYYQGKPIRVKCYDEWGGALPDAYIDWSDVTVNGNTMTFALPNCYSCTIIYYTTYEDLDENDLRTYTNNAKVTINGVEQETNASADVVGFIPRVVKSASGDDGEYVYFKIEADIPSVIKDRGRFFLTDHMAFWGYNNAEGHLYVENMPEDIVITATTESGQTITFSPYTDGGATENTYKLIYPSGGVLTHSFDILFNTADDTTDSSKWILDEESVLTITYKIPFDAKTGTEWEGELTGDKTLEDVLLEGYKLSNEAYLTYMNDVQGTGTASYEYSPKITKESLVNDDGTIDYTVIFNNTVPGSGGNDGYVDGTVDVAYFNDTFDERLEYVPGSLVVTCYSPWQKELWLAQYKYYGEVTGNSFSISSRDLVFYDYNEAANAYGWNSLSGAATFREYYHWINAGGRFVFTYTLKVKDEYLVTTDHARFHLDNTAEFTWGPDGTSGPVTESSEYETGLIGKQVVQEDSKLLFQVHINRSALDILPGSDTLTIEDTMTSNLSVYWESIRLTYLAEDGQWIDFNSAESDYTYTITYDPALNMLTFIVPDSLHIIIDYTTLITKSGLVSVNNAVRIDGKAEVSDVIDALFRVKEHSGDASGSNHEITLIKQDGLTNEPLPGATFLLYGPMGDPDAVRPADVSQTITTEDGTVLKFIGSYSTGVDGIVDIETQYLTPGGPYAFVELIAPEGYELLESPTYFYFYEDDPNGYIQTVTTLIAIENFSGSFLIPETGGLGSFNTAIIGFALIATPILYSFIRRKRERRFGKIS